MPLIAIKPMKKRLTCDVDKNRVTPVYLHVLIASSVVQSRVLSTSTHTPVLVCVAERRKKWTGQ